MEDYMAAGASRVMTQMKMDYVPKGSTIEEKIKKYGGINWCFTVY
jgi:uncharacterized protein YqgV (UPF0045/DUF77 family)